jgi:hypothetical protein
MVMESPALAGFFMLVMLTQGIFVCLQCLWIEIYYCIRTASCIVQK